MTSSHDSERVILYKFKHLEPFVYITDLLLTKRLYCPRPSELNDPLEGVLGMTLPSSPAPGAEQHPFDRAVRFWSAAEAELNRYRVCCFSAHPRSLPMWSYYGNGHSGICLELDLTAYQQALVKVEYLEDLASIDHACPKDQLRFKARHWAHEEEYRLVFDPEERCKYIRAEIRSVLIGAAIKQDYIRPLFELCRLMHYPKEIVSFSTSGQFARVPLNRDIAWDP